MSYNNIEELPPFVRLALKPEQAKTWMDYYNKFSETMEPFDARRLAWKSLKNEDPDVRWFEGWASVQIKDQHDTTFNIDSLAKIMPEFIDAGGEFAVQHKSGTYGHVYNFEVRRNEETGAKGLYIEGVLFRGLYRYDRLWEILQKRKADGDKIPIGLSIYAYAEPKMEWICDDGVCGNQIIANELKEISLTFSPSNPEALGIVNGEARAKEEEMTKEEEIKEEARQEPGGKESELEKLAGIVNGLAEEIANIKATLEDYGEILEELKPKEKLEMPEAGTEEIEDEERECSEKKEEARESPDLMSRLEGLEKEVKKLQSMATTPAPPVNIGAYQREKPEDMGQEIDEIIAKSLFGKRRVKK